MEKVRLVIICFISVVVLSSCELDNYEGPTAGLSGSFIDSETGDLIQQDIIRGTEIELIEHGYDPVASQYLNAKNDGTYSNELLFANTYTVQPVRGNFIPIGPQEVEIREGGTVLDFEVTPYLRIIDAEIKNEDNRVTATFSIQQNVISNISQIGLYVDTEPNVGEPVRLMASEQNINSVVDEDQVFELSLNVIALESGKPYFFRIGALIDEDEAKFNYAPTIRIDL